MDYREAYEKALQLLNVRFLSEGELKAKLRRRGVDDDVLEDVVAALEGEHFLDDQRLARDVYRYYARKGSTATCISSTACAAAAARTGRRRAARRIRSGRGSGEAQVLLSRR